MPQVQNKKDMFMILEPENMFMILETFWSWEEATFLKMLSYLDHIF